MGREPEAMFRRAISELGGMKQFVKPGQKVVVKPNIGWEYVCPARPFRAIYIEGNPVQKEAKPFKESEEHKVEIDDFGF